MKLNEIFPGLRRLTLDSIRVSDPSIFDTKFRHLKHVKIRFSPPLDGEAPSLNESTEDDSLKVTKIAIQNLFEKNPQIKDVVLVHCTKDYVRMVEKMLPTLDTLQAIHILEKIE